MELIPKELKAKISKLYEIEEQGNVVHFTSEGWECLLQNQKYKELAINSLSQILFIYKRVEFKYNDTFYEIFESCSNSGYVVNIYSSSEKNDDGDYFDVNMLDGGLCTGNSQDAIEFML